KFLPEADAFVLITSYDSPLSEEEVRALHRIRHADKVLFVVVNKHDTVTVGERGQVLEFVKERLAEYSFSREPQVFTVSARQALEGKHSGNEEVLEASSIRKFEDALLAFLIEEKAEAFLASMQERILAFLTERRGMEDLPEHKDLIEDLVERLRALCAAEVNPSPLPSDRSGTAPRDIGITLERRSGCWVCGQILEAVFRFLSKHQYQLTIDRDTQHEHAKRGGFCSLHTWQYENISSPYGVCASYPALAHRVALELQEIADNLNGANRAIERISRLAASKSTCQVCQVRIDAEQRAVGEAADRVRKMTAESTGAVPALCLIHLAMTSTVLGNGESARVLLGAHAEFLERLAEDAQRYALRHDALRRYLTSEEERRASQLLLLMLAGHRNVSAPWQVEFLL
ncbi:MAG TPA: hypothetical protein VL991_05185, partial [Terracidiphilus sp.]|nr:hypothetical protein [Terracidiphilus sp.]